MVLCQKGRRDAPHYLQPQRAEIIVSALAIMAAAVGPVVEVKVRVDMFQGGLGGRRARLVGFETVRWERGRYRVGRSRERMMGLRDGDAPGRYSSEAVSAKVHGDVTGGGSHGSHDCRRDAIGRFPIDTRDAVSNKRFRARRWDMALRWRHVCL